MNRVVMTELSSIIGKKLAILVRDQTGDLAD